MLALTACGIAYYHFFIKPVQGPKWIWKMQALGLLGLLYNAYTSSNSSSYQVLSLLIAYSLFLLIGFAEPKKKPEELEKE